MKIILVTGASGFMGRNLCVALRRHKDFKVLGFDLPQPEADLLEMAMCADVVFHLAGVNRPKTVEEFQTGNAALTHALCSSLATACKRPVIVLSSSIQAEMDNPYGRSKKSAEDTVVEYHEQTGAPVYIYRFPNVFGKWSRPNYNSVIATFCHNICRGLPVQISNRENIIRFVYIDDIVREFIAIASRAEHDRTTTHYEIQPTYNNTLGELHDLLRFFGEAREKSLLPDLQNPLTRFLFSTYVSFLDVQDFAYPVQLKSDDRGWLFELIKSHHAGQIFVSRTRPGITRGNHYHDTKVEKFCVVHGEGTIRFRSVLPKPPSCQPSAQAFDPQPPHSQLPAPDSQVIEYHVDDRNIRIVDIPPGYTHSIENTGISDMITLFWASEIFDPARPDTHSEIVL